MSTSTQFCCLKIRNEGSGDDNGIIFVRLRYYALMSAASAFFCGLTTRARGGKVNLVIFPVG